jgi:hypothetical protein
MPPGLRSICTGIYAAPSDTLHTVGRKISKTRGVQYASPIRWEEMHTCSGFKKLRVIGGLCDAKIRQEPRALERKPPVSVQIRRSNTEVARRTAMLHLFPALALLSWILLVLLGTIAVAFCNPAIRLVQVEVVCPRVQRAVIYFAPKIHPLERGLLFQGLTCCGF